MNAVPKIDKSERGVVDSWGQGQKEMGSLCDLSDLLCEGGRCFDQPW